jgi:hypothetical protein
MIMKDLTCFFKCLLDSSTKAGQSDNIRDNKLISKFTRRIKEKHPSPGEGISD